MFRNLIQRVPLKRNSFGNSITANRQCRSPSSGLSLGKEYSTQSQKVKSADEILKAVIDSPQQMIKLTAIDIDGVPRGKYVSKEKFLSAVKSGASFCSVIFGWDVADVLYDNAEKVGWHMGYADFNTSIDLNTFRTVPWEKDTPLFIMDFVDKKTGHALELCPRNLLKKVLNQAENSGFKAFVGCEFEFFNYIETPKSLKEKNYVEPEPLTPGMFGYSLLRTGRNREYFTAMMEQLPKFGVPIEGIHTETGPGVYEAAIQFCEALESADRAFLFKMGVKDIARDFGVIPTFMAKPSAKLPGCGGHMHASLTDLKGNSIFYDEKDQRHMSQLFKHFLAGQMHCLPEIMPMYAPTINSYKRFVEGYWAPTTATWGAENRTVSFRVIGGSPKSLRVEVRIPGADVNPYLGVAASIASGLYGIKHKLELREGSDGSAYGKEKKIDPRDILPRNLHEAATRMGQSEIANELFGETFVKHMVSSRQWEWRQYQTAVTNWETERYFEII